MLYRDRKNRNPDARLRKNIITAHMYSLANFIVVWKVPELCVWMGGCFRLQSFHFQWFDCLISPNKISTANFWKPWTMLNTKSKIYQKVKSPRMFRLTPNVFFFFFGTHFKVPFSNLAFTPHGSFAYVFGVCFKFWSMLAVFFIACAAQNHFTKESPLPWDTINNNNKNTHPHTHRNTHTHTHTHTHPIHTHTHTS